MAAFSRLFAKKKTACPSLLAGRFSGRCWPIARLFPKFKFVPYLRILKIFQVLGIVCHVSITVNSIFHLLVVRPYWLPIQKWLFQNVFGRLPYRFILLRAVHRVPRPCPPRHSELLTHAAKGGTAQRWLWTPVVR